MTAQKRVLEAPSGTRKRAAPEAFDPMLHISPAEIQALRGPYVRRPNDDAAPSEWVYWAEDVMGEAQLARAILNAADAKKATRPK